MDRWYAEAWVGFRTMHTDPDLDELRTERLLLRRSRPQDAPAISAYRSDPAVHAHQGWSDTTPEHIRREIEEMLARTPGEPGGWVQFTVVTLDGDELVGDVGIKVDDEPGVVLVGYTISPAHQGRGYATEAVQALVEYAFETLGAEVVRAYAEASNTASLRVAEKVGMPVVERFEEREGQTVWRVVRMEGRRVPASG
jgi:RimJ/RimL family protein N-acetyltransferase